VFAIWYDFASNFSPFSRTVARVDLASHLDHTIVDAAYIIFDSPEALRIHSGREGQ
jgi:hypothetical protein